MRMLRKWLAVAVLLAATSPTVVGLMARDAGAQNDRANITAHYTDMFSDSRHKNFVRHPDTTCACLSDTTMGPSVYVFGARRIIWKVQANSGTCSTLTVQVSNNDTTYYTPPAAHFSIISSFSVGDSLNSGGVLVTMVPRDSVRPAIGISTWRYARMFVRQREGVTSNNDCTILCRSKCDSLRFKAYVQWTDP